MVTEEGFVVDKTDDGWARVITNRRSACGSCRAAHCCSSMGSSTKMVIRALDKSGAKPGDLVTMHLQTNTAIKSAAIAYMIPVAGLIGGAITGVRLSHELGTGESATSIVIAIVGLALGFVTTMILSKWMSWHGQVTPVIDRIVRTGISAPDSFMAVDPVCMMAVDPSKAPASSIYKERTYYFCNRGCKEAFLKDPERYL